MADGFGLHTAQVPLFVDPVQRVVNFESMVRFRGSSYSVPPSHAGQPVMVAADGGHVVVTVDDMIIAERDHLAELRKITNERVPLPDDAPRWTVRFDQAVATTPLTTCEEVVA